MTPSDRSRSGHEQAAHQPPTHVDTQQPATAEAPKLAPTGGNGLRADPACVASIRKLCSVLDRLEPTPGQAAARENLAAKPPTEAPPFDKKQAYVHELHACGDLDDEAFLRRLSLLTGIPDSSERFAREALVTRRLRAHLDALQAELLGQQLQLWSEGKSLLSYPFLLRLAELLDAADPAFWGVCTECGRYAESSRRRARCKVCLGSGYEFL